MNDFTTVVLAFGRGIIKLLISGLVGFGVALLVIGTTTANRPEVWRMPGPPGELLMGIGAGLLSGGGTLLALFFLPWFFKRPTESQYLEEQPVLTRPAPRSLRHGLDDSTASSRHDPDESAPPTVRPAPPPPRGEPGDAGFYEK